MAEISGALRRTNHPRIHTLESLLAAFDPKSFLLSSNNSTSTFDSETMLDESTAVLQQNDQPRSHTLQSPSPPLDLKAFLLSRNSTSTSPGNSNSAATDKISSAQPPKTHQPTHPLESLFAALDSNYSILPETSMSPLPEWLEFTLADFSVERGPRYRTYSELRESKLRKKHNMMIKQHHSNEAESTVTPPKKKVTFEGPVPGGARNGTSVITRSVPDFSAVLKKENRRPPSSTLPSMLEMTPPLSSKTSKLTTMSSKQVRSKSANAEEKKGGGIKMRKSYASVEELKGLSSAAASAIQGESRGGKGNRGINPPVLGYRHY